MEPTFKTSEVCTQLKISAEGLRKWMQYFSAYLSPKKGRHYTITNDDFMVLATIKEQSTAGLNWEQIDAKLATGYRADTSKMKLVAPVDMVPLQQAIDASHISAELQTALAQVETLQAQLADHADQRAELMEQITTQADRINTLERALGAAEARPTWEQIERLRDEIADLRERAAKAEQEAQTLKENQKRRRWF